MNSNTSRKKRNQKSASNRQLEIELVYHVDDGHGSGGRTPSMVRTRAKSLTQRR